MKELDTFLQRVAKDTEVALEKYLPRDDAPERNLYEAMRYSAFSGGKRVRPALFAATLEAFGKDRKSYLPFMVAIEMLHTYSLIHDDLPCMDNDDLRRGIPSCHRVYGEGMALLAGDALLTHAFYTMLCTNAPAEKVLEAVKLVADLAGCGGMVKGQAAEFSSLGLPHNEELLDYIYQGKTGALFCCAVVSAAILCGATPTQKEQLTEYAYFCGKAFQIADDILDITGTEEEIGKPVGSDQRNEKPTMPVILGCEAAEKAALLAAEKAVRCLDSFDEKADLLRAFPELFVRRKK